MKKKIMVAFLTLAIAVAFIPTFAFAEGDDSDSNEGNNKASKYQQQLEKQESRKTQKEDNLVAASSDEQLHTAGTEYFVYEPETITLNETKTVQVSYHEGCDYDVAQEFNFTAPDTGYYLIYSTGNVETTVYCDYDDDDEYSESSIGYGNNFAYVVGLTEGMHYTFEVAGVMSTSATNFSVCIKEASEFACNIGECDLSVKSGGSYVFELNAGQKYVFEVTGFDTEEYEEATVQWYSYNDSTGKYEPISGADKLKSEFALNNGGDTEIECRISYGGETFAVSDYVEVYSSISFGDKKTVTTGSANYIFKPSSDGTYIIRTTGDADTYICVGTREEQEEESISGNVNLPIAQSLDNGKGLNAAAVIDAAKDEEYLIETSSRNQNDYNVEIIEAGDFSNFDEWEYNGSIGDVEGYECYSDILTVGKGSAYTVELTGPDNQSFTYQWYKYIDDDESYEKITGATGKTLESDSTKGLKTQELDTTRSKTYKCEVTDNRGVVMARILYVFVNCNENHSFSAWKHGFDEDGISCHWRECEDCGEYEEEECNLVHTEAKEETCCATGNNEYWTCSECQGVFKDAEGKTETTVKDETIAKKFHSMTKHEGQDAGCTKAGQKTYWTCSSECCDGIYYLKEDGTESTKNADDLVIPKAKHSLKHIKNASGYLRNGSEYDQCEVCKEKLNYKTLPGYSTSYVKSFKVSKGKKCFTAKWKKQSKKNQKKFNGYRIKYSTKSNLAGAKTVYVSKGSSSKKISKLSSKKKYYVEICTYVKKNGSTFYSKGTKKAVTTK